MVKIVARVWVDDKEIHLGDQVRGLLTLFKLDAALKAAKKKLKKTKGAPAAPAGARL